MTNRKLLYGYKIQDGDLSVVMEEAAVVSRVYSLYAAGLSYQKISDTLNEEHTPYSRERPEWNKHKVKRLLENPRYIGRDGYLKVFSPQAGGVLYDEVHNLSRFNHFHDLFPRRMLEVRT